MSTFPASTSIGSGNTTGTMTTVGIGGSTTIMDGMDANITITMTMMTINADPAADAGHFRRSTTFTAAAEASQIARLQTQASMPAPPCLRINRLCPERA